MSPPKTPYDPLVRLRKHEEDEARASTVAARRRAEDLEGELAKQRAQLDAAPAAACRAEYWHAEELLRERKLRQLEETERALARTREEVDRLYSLEQEAARKRHVAEMLADKARAELMEAEGRKERRALDEAALVRFVANKAP